MGRLGHTLSTLRPVGRPTGRKTRFRLLARLYRVGSLSHWVPPKGFFDASYIAFLLSQAFPGASALRSDFGSAFRLIKQELIPTSEGFYELTDTPRYNVCLNGQQSTCECNGFSKQGHCKHVEGLTVLRQRTLI